MGRQGWGPAGGEVSRDVWRGERQGGPGSVVVMGSGIVGSRAREVRQAAGREGRQAVRWGVAQAVGRDVSARVSWGREVKP